MLQRPFEPGQYTSFRLAAHLAREEIAASIGSVGDALDNALMESTIGLFKVAAPVGEQDGPGVILISHNRADVRAVAGTAACCGWARATAPSR